MSEREPGAERKRARLATPDGIRTVTEDTAQRLIRALDHSQPIRHLRGSQLATAVIGAVGLALFIVGVERVADDLPVVDNGWGSIGVGLVLLAVTGALFRRLGGQ